MKILIVDDERNITDFFSQLARASGHEDIDTAGSGEEAVTLVLRNTYDLITLDIQMPGVSGLEIIGMLRNMNPHAILAIISGYIPEEIPEEVATCADVMISKPISVKKFTQLLEGAEQICQTMEKIRLLGTAPLITR